MRLCQMRYGKPVCLFFIFLMLLILNTGISGAYAAAPVMSGINDQTTKEDTAITVAFTINANSSPFPFPLPSDTPSQDTPVTVTVTSDNRVLVPNANIIHNSSGTDHTLTITPAGNQYGQATIIVTADDGSLSSMQTFVLTVTSVNDAPVVAVPDAQTMEEGKKFVFGSTAAKTITVSDIDAGSNSVETTVSAGHGTLTAGSESGSGITGNQTAALKLTGTIEQINNWLNGLIYTPDADWNGTDTLTVTINDKGHSGESESSGLPFPFPGTGTGTSLSDTKTTTFTVTSVNDPLSLGIPQTVQVTDEDTDLVFSADTGNAVSVTDADGISGEFEVEMQVENGSVSIPQDTGLTEESDGEGHLLLRGGLSIINTALAGLIYEPDPNWHGEDSLTIAARDLVNSETKTGEITVQVNSVNDAPELDNSAEIVLSSVAMNDETPPEIRIGDMIQDAVTDADEDDEPGIAVVSADNAIGTWEYSVNDGTDWSALGADTSQSHAVLLSDDDQIRFMPLPNLTGKASITFRAWDGSDGKTAGSIADTGENGGAGAFSQNIATASATVSDIPEPPEPNAGADQEITEGNTVTLNGSQSVIPAGAEISIAWSQANALSVTLSDIHSLSPSFTAPEVGTEGMDLLFTLTLTDADGNAWTDSTVVKVKDSGTQSLKADAGADQEITEGNTVTLNGSQSVIPAGAEISIAWSQANALSVTLSDIHSLSPSFTAPEVGTGGAELVFTLTLTDSVGNTRTDSTVVKVKDSGTSQPGESLKADAGADQEADEGDVVTLNGLQSVIPTGVAPFYKWEQTSGTAVTLSSPNLVSTTFVAPTVASGTQAVLIFRLTISDNSGNSHADTVTVKANKSVANYLPAANAGADQNVKKGDTVTLNGAASYDTDGSIVAWQWKELSNAAMVLTTPANVSTTFTAPSGGSTGKTLSFELTVTDNAGQQAKDTVTVYVAADTVVPEGDSVTVTEGGTVTLKGSEAGNFGSDASYSWVQISGPTVELSDPNTADPTFVTPAVGAEGANLVFQLTVTSGGSQVYRGSVTVIVQNNGITITGAPEDALTFRPVTTVEMGIKVGNNGKLIRLDAVDPASITDKRNRPESLVYGMIRMEIRTAAAGDTVPVTLYLNNSVADGYKWYKYSEKNGWSDFSANTVISADRKQITLTLTDGGAGDSDGLVNRMIVDPSGLGKPSSGTSESGGGDGDGSSCFIRSASADMLHVLARMMSGFCR